MIIPSLIAKDQKELEERYAKVKDYADFFQIDVMDGKFVPNHSNDFDFKLEGKFEVHLMIEDPDEWVKENIDKVKLVIIHLKTCKDPDNIIEFVKSRNRKIGIALNPEVDAGELKPFIDRIDKVLILTVHPGKYGSEFLPETLGKIRKIKEMRDIPVEVDGGINPDTISLAKEAGADMFVSGSYIMGSDNPGEAIGMLKRRIQQT